VVSNMAKDINFYEFDNSKYILKEDLVRYIKDNTNYEKDSSIRWVIHELVKEGKITKLDSSYYYKGVLKEYYPKNRSDKLLKLQKIIKDKYPDMDIIIYEITILNEWLNHQISRNVIFVEVEKYFVQDIFDFIRGRLGGVLYNPSRDDFYIYAENDVVVVTNLITRAPMNKKETDIIIEKLIVDIFSNDLISTFYSLSELETIIEGIFANYKINIKKVMTYAKRRNLGEILTKYVRKYVRERR